MTSRRLPSLVTTLVTLHAARHLLEQFAAGASVRQLARRYGLSVRGVEDLIRVYGWKRGTK